MFNLKNIKLIKGQERDSKYFSFVGLKKGENNKLEFWLPYGFESFPDNSFEDTKRVFFYIYKALKKFNSRTYKNSKDGTTNSDYSNGFNLIIDKNDEEVILYSKISMLDIILDTFDELSIFSLISKQNKSDEINFSQIDRYMDKCYYLKNDLIYIDYMQHNKNIINYSSTDIIEMFCYIYIQIKRELEELELVKDEIIYLSEKFKNKYLKSHSSLFDENNFEDTILMLKNAFDNINKKTLYKDNNYWNFYNAIEIFLYGQIEYDGNIFWGITNFSLLWEEMGFAYMFQKEYENILYADSSTYSNTFIKGHNVYVKETFDVPFFLEESISKSRRYFRPDIVLYNDDYNDYKEQVEEGLIKDIYGMKISKTANEDLIDVKFFFNTEYQNKYKSSFLSFMTRLQNLISGKVKRNINSYNFKNYDKKLFEKVKNEEIYSELKRNKKNISNYTNVIDFKYVPISCFTSKYLSEKIILDITKQLVYEFSLSLVINNSQIKSQFFIPYFINHPKKMSITVESQELNDNINNKGIELLKIDFYKMLNLYLNK